MTKDVLISISGMQISDGDSGDVELITTGSYYKKNGKHYVVYDEVLEGNEGVVKNTIKIHPDRLDIIRRGSASVHMTFQQDRKNLSCYATPFGDMMVGIQTNQVVVKEDEDSLKVQVEYSLDLNYQHVSECNIVMDICSKSKADLHLSS